MHQLIEPAKITRNLSGTDFKPIMPIMA